MNCLNFAQFASVETSPHQGGLFRRARFWSHWASCSACRAYREELKQISEAHNRNSTLSGQYSGRIDDLKRRLASRVRSRLTRP